MGKKRVVITGMGAITPIGNNLNNYWESLKNGLSGSKPIKSFDASNFKTFIEEGKCKFLTNWGNQYVY